MPIKMAMLGVAMKSNRHSDRDLMKSSTEKAIGYSTIRTLDTISHQDRKSSITKMNRSGQWLMLVG